MASSHTPIVFTVETSHISDYHLVSRRELANYKNMDTKTIDKIVTELNARVDFTRRNFRGRYDAGHGKWMSVLVAPLKPQHKLDVSLDALVAASKAKGCKFVR